MWRAARDERRHRARELGDIGFIRVSSTRTIEMLPFCSVFIFHQSAPVRGRPSGDAPLGLKSSPRRRLIWRASSVRPRLMRDFTVPSGRSRRGNVLIRQFLDVAHQHGRPQRVRAATPAPSRSSVTRSRCSRAAMVGPGPTAAGVSSLASTSRSIVSRSLRTLR